MKSSVLTVSDDLEVEDYEKLKKSLGLVECLPESESDEAPKIRSIRSVEAPKNPINHGNCIPCCKCTPCVT